jgi:hypothetical protein
MAPATTWKKLPESLKGKEPSPDAESGECDSDDDDDDDDGNGGDEPADHSTRTN